MTKFESRREVLKNQITELEADIAVLKEKLEEINEAEQHQMIDHLEDYIDVVDTKSTSLKAFWQVCKSELTILLKNK